jgi:hypothetical protein
MFRLFGGSWLAVLGCLICAPSAYGTTPPPEQAPMMLGPSLDWGESRRFKVEVYRSNYYYVGSAPADPINLVAFAFDMRCETREDGAGRAIACTIDACQLGIRRVSMERPKMKACSWSGAVGLLKMDATGRARSFRIEEASASDGAHDILRAAMGSFELEFPSKPVSLLKEWRQKGSPMLMQQWGKWGSGSYRMRHSLRRACLGGTIYEPKIPATVGCTPDPNLVQIDTRGSGVQVDVVTGSSRVESEFSGAAIFDPALGMVVAREAVTESAPSQWHAKGPLDTWVKMTHLPAVPAEATGAVGEPDP